MWRVKTHYASYFESKVGSACYLPATDLFQWLPKGQGKQNTTNVGRIQARTIKARRRHGEQTCRPANLRAHYHASFFFFHPEHRLIGHRFHVLANVRSRTITKWRKYVVFCVKIEPWNGCLSFDEITVIWFFESTHKYAFLWRLVFTSTEPKKTMDKILQYSTRGKKKQ